MPRINPTVNKESYKIYEKLDRNERGAFVSRAIIELEERENNPSISDQIKSAIEEHVRRYHRKDD